MLLGVECLAPQAPASQVLELLKEPGPHASLGHAGRRQPAGARHIEVAIRAAHDVRPLLVGNGQGLVTALLDGKTTPLSP